MCLHHSHILRLGDSHLNHENYHTSSPPHHHHRGFPGASLLKENRFEEIKNEALLHSTHGHKHLILEFGGNASYDKSRNFETATDDTNLGKIFRTLHNTNVHACDDNDPCNMLHLYTGDVHKEMKRFTDNFVGKIKELAESLEVTSFTIILPGPRMLKNAKDNKLFNAIQYFLCYHIKSNINNLFPNSQVYVLDPFRFEWRKNLSKFNTAWELHNQKEVINTKRGESKYGATHYNRHIYIRIRDLVNAHIESLTPAMAPSHSNTEISPSENQQIPQPPRSPNSPSNNSFTTSATHAATFKETDVLIMTQTLKNHLLEQTKQHGNKVIAANGLTESDLSDLREATWINNDILDTYFNFITTRSHLNSKLPRVFILPTSFSVYLMKDDINKVYNDLSTLLPFTELQNDIIFFPCYLSHHWSLITYYPAVGILEFLDSMKPHRSDPHYTSLLHKVSEFIHAHHHHNNSSTTLYTQIRDDIPTQTNSVDCGIFLLYNTELTSRGTRLNFNQSDANTLRLKTTYELLNNTIVKEVQVQSCNGPTHVYSNITSATAHQKTHTKNSTEPNPPVKPINPAETPPKQRRSNQWIPVKTGKVQRSPPPTQSAPPVKLSQRYAVLSTQPADTPDVKTSGKSAVPHNYNLRQRTKHGNNKLCSSQQTNTCDKAKDYKKVASSQQQCKSVSSSQPNLPSHTYNLRSTDSDNTKVATKLCNKTTDIPSSTSQTEVSENMTPAEGDPPPQTITHNEDQVRPATNCVYHDLETPPTLTPPTPPKVFINQSAPVLSPPHLRRGYFNKSDNINTLVTPDQWPLLKPLSNDIKKLICKTIKKQTHIIFLKHCIAHKTPPKGLNLKPNCPPQVSKDSKNKLKWENQFKMQD